MNPENYAGKIVRVGEVEGHFMFCGIQYKNGKLSISGVIGPKHNGDAYGSCGQIVGSFKGYGKHGYYDIDDIELAPGWSKELVKQFFDVWDKWHLNNMRPNCEHQVGPEWENYEIEVVKYRLSYRCEHEIEKVIVDDVGDVFKLDNVDGLKAALKKARKSKVYVAALIEAGSLGLIRWEGDCLENGVPEDKYPNLTELIKKGVAVVEEKKRETKYRGWVNENEHSLGLLGKVCPVCQYKWGNAWKFEEVPSEVIAFLNSLPDTDVLPAWI